MNGRRGHRAPSWWPLVIGIVLVLGACGTNPAASPTPASPTPTAHAEPAGWEMVHRISERPFDPTAATAWPGGYLVMGTVTEQFPDDDDCVALIDSGRAAWSADGREWHAAGEGVFDFAHRLHAVALGSTIYVLGEAVDRRAIFEGTCPRWPDRAGLDIWRSDDGAQTWHRLPQPAVLQDAVIHGVMAVGGQLVVLGDGTDPGDREPGPRVWTSVNGMDWHSSDTVPPSATVWAVAGSTIVAGGNESFPVFSFSEDAGRTWQPSAFDWDPEVRYYGVAGREGRFVALGPVGTPVAIDGRYSVRTSNDGRTWQAGPTLEMGQAWIPRLVALPDRFVAFGVTLEREPDGAQRWASNRMWVSGDGISWRESSGTLPGVGKPLEACAVGNNGVVCVDDSFLGPGLGEVWFAPLNTFD